MNSIRDILKSTGFKREVSLLLFFFAGLNILTSLIIFLGGPSNLEVAIVGVWNFIVGIIVVVLGLMIRRGSNKALLVCGILWGLETVLIFIFPLEQGTATQLLARAFLAFLLIRYVWKRRMMSTSPDRSVNQELKNGIES